jgi:GDP-L-fucose synthase
LAAKPTVLVTGGSGFIGRNIRLRLGADYEVIAPSHRELDLLSQDPVDRFFREQEVDYVIHCANVGGNRKEPDARDVVGRNLRMFFNLARNCDRFSRMIHFGSGAEYDKSRPLVRVAEEEFGRRIPGDEYGFSKYAISRCIGRSDNICCLRLFGVFGPGEDYEYKFISNAIVKNLAGMPIRIMQNVYFDWLYVDDLAGVVRHFLEREPAHRFYNVTTGRTTDLLSIARAINDLAGMPSEITVANEGLNLEYSGDNSRLLGELPGYRFTSMRDAIGALIEYYRGRLDSMDLDAIRRDAYAGRCAVNKGGSDARP